MQVYYSAPIGNEEFVGEITAKNLPYITLLSRLPLKLARNLPQLTFELVKATSDL